VLCLSLDCSWQPPDPITQRVQFRNTVQVSPIPLILVPNSKNVPGATPSCGLSETASLATPSITPPADTPSSDKPRMQPLSSAAPGYEHYYGTRLSTVLLIRRDGSVVFIERDVWRLGADGKPERLDYKEGRKEGDVQQRVFEFQLNLNLRT